MPLVPMRTESEPPFRVDVTVCDGDYEEPPLSLRIAVLVELRRCLLICSTEKNGLQQHNVKICKYSICMEYGRFVPFHTSNLPSHPYAIPYSIPIFSFHSIFHSIPQYALGYSTKTEM